MKTPDRIIALLYDRRDWWTLAELSGATGAARSAGLSRARLDAALAELATRGHHLEYHPSLGVRLSLPAGLDAHLIERGLRTRRVGRHVICFPVVDSTNDTAASSARQTGSDGLVVLSEAQRQGRGRHGRQWLSPPGANVLMSVLLSDPKSQLPHEALTISAGLAVAEGVERALADAGCGGLNCRLKWPNDVLIDGRKVCGVIVEILSSKARRHIVLGVGINVNSRPADDQVDRPAGCLAEQAGHAIERIELIRRVLQRIDHWVVQLAGEPAKAVRQLRRHWQRRCSNLHERLTVAVSGKRITGRVVDIDPLDGLILLNDAGLHVHIPAAGATVV